MMGEDRLLTAREGRLPHICLGRYRRYRRTEILAWLEDQRRGPLVGRPHR